MPLLGLIAMSGRRTPSCQSASHRNTPATKALPGTGADREQGHALASHEPPGCEDFTRWFALVDALADDAVRRSWEGARSVPQPSSAATMASATRHKGRPS